MSLREKEKAKEQQEKFQAILSALLKDEDNKYCVDCDAKGPRWASWNLGLFLCIRCAGIHRNLGVHISRVKSVNLDTWTGEQVAMMQEIGNSRARAAYEANIPDGFRRPQSDSALEAFVRAKYEQKKYMAREWVPPNPKVPKEWLEDSKNDKKRARPKTGGASQIQLGGTFQGPKAAGSKPAAATSNDSSARPAQAVKAEVKVPQPQQAKPEPAASSAANDLLGLDLGSPQNNHQAVAPAPQSSSNELLDLFGGQQAGSTPAASAPVGNSDLMNGGSSEGNLFEGEGGAGEEKKASTKDSIMALFGGAGGGGGAAPAGQQQMYNIPASSAALAQNGAPVLSASSPMPGGPTMINGSGFGGNSMQQAGMAFGMAQPQQFNPALSTMTSQPQQVNPLMTSQGQQFNPALSTMTSQPQQFNPALSTMTSPQQQFNPALSTMGGQPPQQMFNSNPAVATKLQAAGMVPPQQPGVAVGVQPSPSVGSVMQSPRPNSVGNVQPQKNVSATGSALIPGQAGQGQQQPPGMMMMMTPKSTAAAAPTPPQPSVFGQPVTGAATQSKGGSAMPQGFGQPPRPAVYFGQPPQTNNFYGGMYMPQGQQAYPGMMPGNMMSGQQQNMMPGQQQNMMQGQQQNMMPGQQQNMMPGQQPGAANMMGYQPNMMGQQPQGMMGAAAMNGAQVGMYGNQMMPGAGQSGQGVYTPQQMQQMQFQQMQQQMASMNMGGPQQMQGGWGGNPAAGQTLSNNLWQ